MPEEMRARLEAGFAIAVEKVQEVSECRALFEELGQLIDKPVRVEGTDGKVYDGVLLGYDGNSLSVCLGDVEGDQGTKIHRAFI